MSETCVLYARINSETKEWLDTLAEQSGLSVAKIVDALLGECRRRGLTIEARVAWTVNEP